VGKQFLKRQFPKDYTMDQRVFGCETMGIIEASSIVIHAVAKPARYVLRRHQHKFIVQKQILKACSFDPERFSCGFSHHDFLDTHIFSYGTKDCPPGCIPVDEATALIAAAKFFNQRKKCL
jgi:hypothetical protein